MENNRKIVQEGLNKRSAKRTKAIIEAEQEVITVQMFNVVNNKVHSASAIFYQPAYREEPVCKANKKPSKKLIRLRNVSAINTCASLAALIILAAMYFIYRTELPIMIVTAALPALMLIYNIVHLTKAQKKLKRRK